MTFNRYILLRAIIETVGALSCVLQILMRNDLIGIVVTVVVALAWVGGELWVVMVLRRNNPRRDELSDLHQGLSMQFALITLIAVLVAVGFVYTILNLTSPYWLHVIPPMLLPALAMAALALSDIRYLWLERSGADGDDDED